MATATPPKPLTRAEWAAKFGLALALVQSDTGLLNLFNKAISTKMSEAAFSAALRQTTWYTRHSESWRQAETTYQTDRQTYNAHKAETRASLVALAGQMGAALDKTAMDTLADNVYRFGYNDAQAKALLASYVNVSKDTGDYMGGAQGVASALRKIAYDNGMKYSDDWYKTAVMAVVGGTGDIGTYTGQIRAEAAGTYKQYADRLKAGEDVRAIASNYIQRYAQVLEVNPDEVDLNDKLIDQALTQQTPDGKPGTQSMTDFTRALKADPRWAKTDNARDEMSSSLYSIGKLMGFA